jgi:hypothetical protein
MASALLLKRLILATLTLHGRYMIALQNGSSFIEKWLFLAQARRLEQVISQSDRK